MAAYELKATVRTRVGKGAARELRRAGLIPAVIYGDKQTPVAISLSNKETSRHLHAGGFLTHVGTIDVDGEKISVLPRDYQLDPVRDFLVHVDFLRVSETSRITVEVPVHFVGQDVSPGLKKGGTLNIVHHEVELSVLVTKIPEFIQVDLTSADVGATIHISSITLPEGAVVISREKDLTIATIQAGKGE